MITAELRSAGQLAQLLGAALPTDWPPEYHDGETLRFWRGELSRPGAEGWWLHYVLLAERGRLALVGTVSYKGPPADGIVEIGYSIVPSRQRRGLATEASQGLIDAAWRRGADVVVAHTFGHLEPSRRVLGKLGFDQVGVGEDGELEFRLHRA